MATAKKKTATKKPAVKVTVTSIGALSRQLKSKIADQLGKLEAKKFLAPAKEKRAIVKEITSLKKEFRKYI